MVFFCIFKYFNVFVDGNLYVGEVEEIILFKFICKLEEYCVGGMNGFIDVDFGSEKLELEIIYGGLMCDIFK